MCTLKRFDAYPVNYIGNALECFGVVLFYGVSVGKWYELICFI